MELIKFLTLSLIALSGRHFANAVTYNLPANFKIGAATASYQIEGGWNADGKIPNIWDTMTHERPWSIKDGSSGDEAANSYEFYMEDVKALKESNFQYYRFSISWSRVMKKNGEVNQPGIDYYNKLIDALLANGIDPMVTIYHWDLPQYLQDLGGWPNSIIVKYFEHYADVVFRHFGDRVKTWITFNEPWVFCKVGYAWGRHAPQISRDGTADYLCGHNMLLSHAAAYHLYENKYKDEQGGEVGICLDTNYYYPLNANVTQDTIDKSVNFKFGWFANSIFTPEGGYPKMLRDAVDTKSVNEGRRWSRLPEFTPQQRASLINSADFLAINYYTSRLVIPYKDNPGTEDWTSDSDIYETTDPRWKQGLSDWLFSVPRGIRDQLVWIKNHYNNPKVYISETGWSDPGTLNDVDRVEFYEKHLAAVIDAALIDGCDVQAFTAWSIIDNFEWAEGYTERFGIYQINFTSPLKERTPKQSAFFFRDTISNWSFELVGGYDYE